MRKKILFLTLALGLTGAAAGLFSPSAAAASCTRVCCPSGGCFLCCGLPCDCAS